MILVKRPKPSNQKLQSGCVQDFVQVQGLFLKLQAGLVHWRPRSRNQEFSRGVSHPKFHPKVLPFFCIFAETIQKKKTMKSEVKEPKTLRPYWSHP